MSKENVILVDEKDNQVGLMPKLEAHQKGLLHRAFSIFIFNSIINFYFKNELFLSIIQVDYGQIHVVVIQEMEKIQLMQQIEDLMKKWV